MKKIVIIGLGNILLSDEGIGVHIINSLKELNSFPSAEYLDLGTSSYELINFINKDDQKIVIIDCLKSNGGKPGDVIKLSFFDLISDPNYKFSLHQMKLIDSLKLISIENDLPEILIIGIIPYDVESYSTQLSKMLTKEFSNIIIKVRKIISDFIE